MPLYKIDAYDSGGSRKSLRREAANEEELLKSLRLDGFIPTSVEAESSGAGGAGRVKKLGADDELMFCTMLSAFLESGLALTEVLGILQRQTRDKRLNSIYASLRESVESGRSLARSMESQGAFREFLFGMVEAGERSSSLPAVLDSAASLLRSEISLKRRIQSALIYPILMLIVGSCVVAFLVTYVVPKMTDIVIQAGQTLPLATRILLGVSDAVRAGGIPAAIVCMCAYIYMKRRGVKLRAPFFRGVRDLLTVSLVFSQLAALLKSGVPLVQAIEMSENMDREKGRMKFLAEEVRKGYRFSQSLERQGSYSEDIIAIVRIGEAGGNLPSCLERIASNSWDFAQNYLQKWSSLAEPIIIIILGAVVGFVVLAVLLPIFSLSDLAQL